MGSSVPSTVKRKWPAVHRIPEWGRLLTAVTLRADGLLSLCAIHCLFLLSKYFFHLGSPIVHLGVIELDRMIKQE